MRMEALELRAGRMLLERGMTVSCAESCTGGLLTSRLTDVPGSSAYVQGAMVVYSCELKERLVHVRHETLQQKGAVSAETAQEMAEGVRDVLGTDIGIGVTGLAGPDGDGSGRPVGLVYISVSGKNGTIVKECRFCGSREEIKQRSAERAIRMLVEYLGGCLL